MRPQQKRIQDLATALGRAVARLGDVRGRVAAGAAPMQERVEIARLDAEVVADLASALALAGEALASTREDILSDIAKLNAELAALDVRIAERGRQVEALPAKAAAARRALEEAIRDLEAARAKDRPLIQRLEGEIARLQRRITTARAYHPEPLKALFPGGAAEGGAHG